MSYAQDQTVPASHQLLPENLDAYGAVHEGNRLLLEGDPASAMDYYLHAQELKPDAREVDFVKGLGHYALEEYEEARQAFQKAVAGRDNALSNDALYSLGTAYHAEALASRDDPQLALSLLESAMRQYHNVLSDDPDHQAARDANYKAATLWRNIKEILKQQQQDQQQNDDKNQENEDQQQQQDQQQDQQQQQPQQSSEDTQQQDQQTDPQQAKARQQEQVSREQARRKLREMMQALRERKKTQREKRRLIPMWPVDKDW